jgi:hypothetical protein
VNWAEPRIYGAEQRIEYLLRQIQDLTDMVKAAQQLARSAFQQPGNLNSSGSGVFFCLPTTLAGASGSWPSLTPSSQSLTVYQASGTSLTSMGTATVYNWYPASPAASKVCFVLPDGAGNYVVVDQSCS